MGSPMNSIPDLDVFRCELDGINLIEASAGTGKTWNICGLYLRLLLERELTVEALLVVTFGVTVGWLWRAIDRTPRRRWQPVMLGLLIVALLALVAVRFDRSWPQANQRNRPDDTALAAGQAKAGLRPIVDIYSTFLQRSFDQVFQEMALQNLPVTFVLDRAGLTGTDGPTHHGVFDISYLRCLPNTTVMAPSDADECRRMLTTAFRLGPPAAVRYPRGAGPAGVDHLGLHERLAQLLGLVGQQGSAGGPQLAAGVVNAAGHLAERAAQPVGLRLECLVLELVGKGLQRVDVGAGNQDVGAGDARDAERRLGALAMQQAAVRAGLDRRIQHLPLDAFAIKHFGDRLPEPPVSDQHPLPARRLDRGWTQ